MGTADVGYLGLSLALVCALLMTRLMILA